MLHLQSMPARGRSASSYEAADKKTKTVTLCQLSLDRQEMNRDAHAWTECVCIASASGEKQKQHDDLCCCCCRRSFAIIAKVILSKPEYKDLTKFIHSHADTGMIAATGKINQESMKDFGSDAGSKWVPTKRWTCFNFNFQINFETKKPILHFSRSLVWWSGKSLMH